MLTEYRQVPRVSWRGALLLGALVGAVILGIGGRLAMRGVTLWEGRSHLFSLTGTLTVVAWGAGLGALAAILRATLEWGAARLAARRGGHVVPGRSSAVWVALAFAVALVLLTPWSPPRLALFPPVVGAFLWTLDAAWRRLSAAAAGERIAEAGSARDD
jgi:hypothetical protein